MRPIKKKSVDFAESVDQATRGATRHERSRLHDGSFGANTEFAGSSFVEADIAGAARLPVTKAQARTR
jgi:hypothetical protein